MKKEFPVLATVLLVCLVGALVYYSLFKSAIMLYRFSVNFKNEKSESNITRKKDVPTLTELACNRAIIKGQKVTGFMLEKLN